MASGGLRHHPDATSPAHAAASDDSETMLLDDDDGDERTDAAYFTFKDTTFTVTERNEVARVFDIIITDSDTMLDNDDDMTAGDGNHHHDHRQRQPGTTSVTPPSSAHAEEIDEDDDQFAGDGVDPYSRFDGMTFAVTERNEEDPVFKGGAVLSLGSDNSFFDDATGVWKLFVDVQGRTEAMLLLVSVREDKDKRRIVGIQRCC